MENIFGCHFSDISRTMKSQEDIFALQEKANFYEIGQGSLAPLSSEVEMKVTKLN